MDGFVKSRQEAGRAGERCRLLLLPGQSKVSLRVRLMKAMKNLFLICLSLATLFQLAQSFSSTRRQIGRARLSQQLQAGFGSKSTPSGEYKRSKQIKTVTKTDPCVCGSGEVYGSCCGRFHDGSIPAASADPVTLTKARYSAFALGIPSFLIDTTHPEHKDHKRHAEGNMDAKKARKAWEREITVLNSEVFEFLKLELLPENERRPIELAEGESSVEFRVLVRKRKDGVPITFQEQSVYSRAPEGHSSLGVTATKGFSKSASTVTSTKADTDTDPSPHWLYKRGVVSPVSQEDVARLFAEAPKYQPDATIRDRW